tara:strand:- start:5994 stop:6368 length:375 start_codon:yes stop_codon:yes gene_type:complete
MKVLYALLYCAFAFSQNEQTRNTAFRGKPKLKMGFLDGFNKAFENEVFENEVFQKGKSIEVNVCGKKIQALKGQRVIDVIRSSGAPIRFNCCKGDCGSCLCIVNGKKIRVCRMIVTGPLTIKSI